MGEQTLSTRELNRATLARQMLVQRQTIPVPGAIERLVGLQAQLPVSPYVCLWTRLEGFDRDHLASLIEDRSVVKTTLMRATLHLVTADDYVRFRNTLQPMLSSAAGSIAKRRGGDADLEPLLKASEAFIAEKPRTFAEISRMLSELMPDEDVGAMRYAVRMHLPLVQVPIAGGWSFPGNPAFSLAKSWIGRPLSPEDNLPELVLRYLRAFGPASIADIQTWSGIKAKEVVEALKPKLRVYRDERRHELYDLTDAELPPGDIPAPVRFLPEYDNLLLSHNDRSRIIAQEHRARVFLPGLRVRGTILVDGFVAGVWKVEKAKSAATLVVEPFDTLTRRDRDALVDEGEALVRFLETKVKSVKVEFGSLAGLSAQE